jgi:hypothetical protein
MTTYEEVDNLNSAELRFRQACQFHALFKDYHGVGVDPLATRLLWMCYADAFLMMLVSLRDFVPQAQKNALNGSDLFRMMTVLRNVTVHRAVVAKGSPLAMIVRDIHIGGPLGKYENVMLGAARVEEALNHYEQELKKEVFGKKTRWDWERDNVEGARRWNKGLAAQATPRIRLSEVFLETLRFVASTCGFTLPTGL